VAGRGGNRTRLLLIVLLVTSLLFITLDLRGISFTKTSRSVSQTVFRPVEKVVSKIFSPVGNFFSNIKNFPRIKSEVTTLKTANSKLHQEILKYQDNIGKYQDLQKDFNLAGEAGFKVVPAEVIARGAADSFTQTITIDAGTADGISNNMTVMNGDGIVGVTRAVTSNTSIVELMSDPNFKMGVRIVGTGSAGVLLGEGDNQFTFQLLDPQGSLSTGAALVSLGSDQNRPFVAGLPVGYITQVNTTSRDITQQATVKSYANLNSLDIVLVVLKGANHDLRDSLIPPAPAKPVIVLPAPIDTATATTETATKSTK
jgi:rod shape-determining protein MreC